MYTETDQLIQFLLEADDEVGTDATNISDAENDTKDLNDTDDVKSDENDQKDETESEENEDNSEESDEEPTENEDDSNNDDQNSTDENPGDGDGIDDSATSEEESPEIIRKKLNVYNNLDLLWSSYKSLDDIYDKLIMSDTSPNNQKIFIIFSNKIKFNLENMEKLVSDPGVVKDNDYPSLLAILNTYRSDLNAIKANLKLILEVYRNRNEKYRKSLRRKLQAY
ncbi:hypothetical protein [Proteus mirabilis]|uniref:hypothetical protein n=1 Tax=Proteus mirabilis TaxID=584 RepID=UPI0034D48225